MSTKKERKHGLTKAKGGGGSSSESKSLPKSSLQRAMTRNGRVDVDQVTGAQLEAGLDPIAERLRPRIGSLPSHSSWRYKPAAGSAMKTPGKKSSPGPSATSSSKPRKKHVPGRDRPFGRVK